MRKLALDARESAPKTAKKRPANGSATLIKKGKWDKLTAAQLKDGGFRSQQHYEESMELMLQGIENGTIKTNPKALLPAKPRKTPAGR